VQAASVVQGALDAVEAPAGGSLTADGAARSARDLHAVADSARSRRSGVDQV